MKRVVLLLCLAGAAGVWAWALLAPRNVKLEPLPARFVGTYKLAGFDPPPGRTIENPLPPGAGHAFTFRENGTYVFSVLVSSGYEVLRREGVVAVSGSGVLTLDPISTNRREDRAPPEKFHAEWGEDQGGRFLALRHTDLGYTLRLRP
ncbi:MAG: hypothetical protein ACHQ1G_04460 [Planctomycetota bacterium]